VRRMKLPQHLMACAASDIPAGPQEQQPLPKGIHGFRLWLNGRCLTTSTCTSEGQKQSHRHDLERYLGIHSSPAPLHRFAKPPLLEPQHISEEHSTAVTVSQCLAFPATSQDETTFQGLLGPSLRSPPSFLISPATPQELKTVFQADTGVPCACRVPIRYGAVGRSIRLISSFILASLNLSAAADAFLTLD
jgi:hypothetical protein